MSVDFKNRLRSLSRGINLFNAKQLTEQLKAIHLDYMTECSSNDSKLGYHSKKYLEALAAKKESIVPLSSVSWSADLSLMNFTASMETRKLKAFSSTIETYSTAPKTLESLSKDFGSVDIRKGNALERFENTQAIALSNLRRASANGEFDLAWSIFRHHFDLRVIASRSTRCGSPPRADGYTGSPVSKSRAKDDDDKFPGSRRYYHRTSSPEKRTDDELKEKPKPLRKIDTGIRSFLISN